MTTARVDRWLLAAVAAAGALVGHGIGYGLGAAAPTTSHGHLTVLGPVVIGLAGIAALVIVLPWVRRAPGRLTVRELAGAQIGAYLVLELVEAALAAPVAHLASPGFVLGLVVQPVVAFVIARVLQVGADLVRWVILRRRDHPRPTRAVPATAASWCAPFSSPGVPRFRRGPPGALVT